MWPKSVSVLCLEFNKKALRLIKKSRTFSNFMMCTNFAIGLISVLSASRVHRIFLKISYKKTPTQAQRLSVSFNYFTVGSTSELTYTYYTILVGCFFMLDPKTRLIIYED
uniref:Uncharacterized protein n=1 Tax=Cacopsylla melanoneura TaxID=428564 RepID=A0A8D8TPS7_9HEMI